MTTYKVKSAKFSGHDVGDTVHADDLDPALNIDALLSSGVLEVAGENKTTKKSAKAEEVQNEETVSYGEDRPY